MKKETLLEKTKRLDKKRAEFEEKIAVMGQESDKKAAPAVIETQKEVEKAEKTEIEDEKNYLDGAKKNYEKYKEALSYMLLKRLRKIDWPIGWKFITNVKPEGVAVIFSTNKGSVHAKGIKPVNLVEYDVNAINVLAEQVENTIDKIQARDNDYLAEKVCDYGK